MVHKTYRLHRAAPSEASPRGNRGDSLFHDCTRFWEKIGYPRERRAPPLPVADEGGLSAPQLRLSRAVAKQDRERHSQQGGRTVAPTKEGRIATAVCALVRNDVQGGGREQGATPPHPPCGHLPLKGKAGPPGVSAPTRGDGLPHQCAHCLAMTCKGGGRAQGATTPHPPLRAPFPQREGRAAGGGNFFLAFFAIQAYNVTKGTVL